MQSSWKIWLIILGIIVAFYLGSHPEIIRGWINAFEGTDGSSSAATENPELTTADLRGRIRDASQYALEVQARLDAYKARFDCPEAMLLDRAFLDTDGPLSIHPLRKEWYAIRTELPQFLEKHRAYQDLLRRADSEIMQNSAKVKEYWTLPAQASAWSHSLDDAITQRTRKLPMFTVVAHQLAAQMNIQERRASKP
jgi:hypothetical protein